MIDPLEPARRAPFLEVRRTRDGYAARGTTRCH